jgi:hypothetical protein
VIFVDPLLTLSTDPRLRTYGLENACENLDVAVGKNFEVSEHRHN